MTVVLKGAQLQQSQVRRFTAGEALVDGDLCYLKSDGKMWKASNAAASTTEGKLGIAAGTIAADAEGDFLVEGDNTGSSLTVGGRVYVGTAGAVTQTAPSSSGEQVRIIGYALTASLWEFSPSKEITVVP